MSERAADSTDDLVFPCKIVVDVQWGDVDRMQHVNNVVYLRWFESVRTRYFEECGIERVGREVGDGVYPILASIRCDYRAQLRYPDTVEVECSTERLGRTSSLQRYRVKSRAKDGAVVAVGEGTWVCFDYRSQSPIAIPKPMIDVLEAYEGRTLPRESRRNTP